MFVFALGSLLIFGPVASFLLGARAKPIENRPLSQRPALSDGWGIFEAATDYLIDRLTIRPRAVRTDAWIDVHVFGENPSFGQSASPEVIVGSDGWLYLAGELVNACHPGITADEAVERWDRLVRVIKTSGRRVVLAVPPDKSTVYPEAMPPDAPDWECAKAKRDELWEQLGSGKVTALLPLRAALHDTMVRTRERLYSRKDTHWNSAGAVVMVQLVVEAIAPELWNGEDVENLGRSREVGDLTNMMGTPAAESLPSRAVVRPGVEEVHRRDVTMTGASPTVHSAQISEGKRALLPGQTLFVHDSFGERTLPSLRQFFEQLITIQWFNAGRPDMIKAIESSDTVILETVERAMHFRASSWLTDEFLSDLERGLTPTSESQAR